MALISDAHLTQMRDQAERLLTDTCDVLRFTTVSDSEGGWTDTWATHLSGVPCRVAPTGLTPNERIIAEKFAAERVYSVTLPAETDVTERDRVVWESTTFGVKSSALATNQILLRLIVEQVI